MPYDPFVAYTETPLGNALLAMGNGERCSTASVLVCPSCHTVYADDERDDAGFCGPCDHVARHTTGRRVRLRRRTRRAGDHLELAFRA